MPSATRAPDRLRSGQRFLHAVADQCPVQLLAPGVEARDLGLHAASGGLATARTLQFLGKDSVELGDADDLRFLFVSGGSGSIEGLRSATLATHDAVELAPGPFILAGPPGLRVLEVTASSVARRGNRPVVPARAR